MKAADLPLPDEALALRDRVAFAAAALDKRFDSRMDELRAVQKDISAKAAIVGSEDDAKKIRAGADAYRADQEKSIKGLLDQIDQDRAALADEKSALDAREDALDKREASLKDAKLAHDKRIMADAGELERRATALDAREKAVAPKEAELKSRADILDSRSIELDAKVSRLRAASAGL